MTTQDPKAGREYAAPPVKNPAPADKPGPNDTKQHDIPKAAGHTVSREPIKTNPSRAQTDPLQVLVDPVDEHKATLNQDFPQNRVDAQGKRYDNAEGPTPNAAASEGSTSKPVPAKGE